ncbi:MAG: hypothetical protein QOE23_3349 [Pseudonocardiales bacterium]|nr:hypothetical protein [Pseudonocardiales bacterium]
MSRTVDRRLVILIVGLLAMTAALTGFSLTHRSHQAAPPWLPNVVACRDTPMTHVHDPGRLVVRGNCGSESGTVKNVRLVSAYDDLKITIAADTRLLPYLGRANNGLVVADVIATDQASVVIPPVGSHITAWGAWVLDKASKTHQLLPAYFINIDELHAGSTVLAGQSTEKAGPGPRRSLKLTVTAPSRVSVGSRIDVTIRAQWLQDRRRTPASEIRLFTEMTTKDGVGVRWKATMTHTTGMAVLHLVAIQVPASYILTVYAAPSRQSVSAAAAIEVTKT